MHGGQKSAFLEWKNPPTGFSKLLHLFPDWLCSPDSYFLKNFVFLLYHLSTRSTQPCSQAHESEEEMAKSGCPLKLLKNWQEKKRVGWGVFAFRSRNKHTFLRSLKHAFIRPFYVVLNKFALWHGTTSKQSTSAVAALSEGRSVWL